MNRRKLLKAAALGSGVVFSNKVGAVSKACGISTVAQTEGPFYPESWESNIDADMTRVNENEALAYGQMVIISGTVIDVVTCQPIANADLDIWQANAFGQYAHTLDASPEELRDKNFQYRCRLQADEKGVFSFKTIKPSPYPAGSGWVRPPHIHFKVTASGYKELTTQMYFKNDPLNERDRILQSMSVQEQETVVVDFTEHSSKVLLGAFQIALVAQA